MSVVYFIQAGAGGPVKIGVASDVERRVAHLQCGCPDELMLLASLEGGADVEARLHWALRPHRHRGEWFRPTSEVLAAVEAAQCGKVYRRAAISEWTSEPTGSAQLLRDIEGFCASHGMPESTFGREAASDWKFVRELRCGRSAKPRRVWPATERKVRRFMAAFQQNAA